jgi:hypothetical protein
MKESGNAKYLIWIDQNFGEILRELSVWEDIKTEDLPSDLNCSELFWSWRFDRWIWKVLWNFSPNDFMILWQIAIWRSDTWRRLRISIDSLSWQKFSILIVCHTTFRMTFLSQTITDVKRWGENERSRERNTPHLFREALRGVTTQGRYNDRRRSRIAMRIIEGRSWNSPGTVKRSRGHWHTYGWKTKTIEMCQSASRLPIHTEYGCKPTKYFVGRAIEVWIDIRSS